MLRQWHQKFLDIEIYPEQSKPIEILGILLDIYVP